MTYELPDGFPRDDAEPESPHPGDFPGLLPRPERELISQRAAETIQRMTPWMRAISIIGLLSLGLITVAICAGFLAGGGIPGLGVLLVQLGIVYVMLGGPLLLLHHSARQFSRASRNGTLDELAFALEMHKKFWKYSGVVALLMIVFSLLFIALMTLMLGSWHFH